MKSGETLPTATSEDDMTSIILNPALLEKEADEEKLVPYTQSPFVYDAISKAPNLGEDHPLYKMFPKMYVDFWKASTQERQEAGKKAYLRECITEATQYISPGEKLHDDEVSFYTEFVTVADGIGAVQPRYVVRSESLLGSGSHGHVRLAYDLKHHRPVAVKTMQSGLPMLSLESEAKAMAAIKHSGIVEVLDVIPARPKILNPFDTGPTLLNQRDQGSEYLMVMEYVDGMNMSEVLNQQFEFEPNDIVAVVDQLSDTLDFMSKLPRKDGKGIGYYHRDIKPSNIMICKDNVVKLADFGVSNVAAPAEGGSFKFGTKEFAPPEAQSESQYDIRSEVFSLAMTAREFFSGGLAYNPKDVGYPYEWFSKGVTKTPYLKLADDPYQTWPKDTLEAVDKVFEKALSLHREDRYSTATEFSDALATALKVPKESRRNIHPTTAK